MKRLIRILAATALAAGLCVTTALAYDYELDPITGEPVGVNTQQTTRYTFSDGSFYAPETARYLYRTSRGEFGASIPNGSTVSAGQTVSLYPCDSSNTLVYRDGEPVAQDSLGQITQTGSYVVNVLAGDGTTELSFRFTILPKVTNAIREISVPTGFQLEYALLDGVAQPLPYGDLFSLSGDGEYEIRYSCAALNVFQILRFTLDTTAPELSLPGVTHGEATGAVTLTFPEDAALVEIDFEGQTSALRYGSTQLRQPGSYRLTVYDAAGNWTSYDLTIQFYLDINGWLALVLVLAAVAAILVYARLVRKNARVG